jgi:hypothetical protein
VPLTAWCEAHHAGVAERAIFATRNVGPDAIFFNERKLVVALAARHVVPAIYADRESAEAGGLMS